MKFTLYGSDAWWATGMCLPCEEDSTGVLGEVYGFRNAVCIRGRPEVVSFSVWRRGKASHEALGGGLGRQPDGAAGCQPSSMAGVLRSRAAVFHWNRPRSSRSPYAFGPQWWNLLGIARIQPPGRSRPLVTRLASQQCQTAKRRFCARSKSPS